MVRERAKGLLMLVANSSSVLYTVTDLKQTLLARAVGSLFGL